MHKILILLIFAMTFNHVLLKSKSNLKSQQTQSVCNNMKCPPTYLCKIRDLDNHSILEYICCSCLPNSYRFIRYEISQRTERVEIYLRLVTNEPVTTIDVVHNDDLPQFVGSWDIVNGSDGLTLKYSIYRLVSPVDYPDE